ncbi:MAG: flavodoxin family protein [Niabella sp.]
MTACTNAQHQNVKTKIENKNILIVYLSRTNNTKAVAEMIQKKTGGDLAAVEPQTPYSKKYQKNVDEVQYQNEHNILPPLKTKIDISKYDTIFVGFPTWGMQLPPPIKTFLNENNWKKKVVAPFNTNAGYGLGKSKAQFEQYCSKGKITEIFTVKGGQEREGIMYVMESKKAVEVNNLLDRWLKKIILKK